MEITKMLTISNGHVSDETWQKLSQQGNSLDTYDMGMSVYEMGGYGFLICCACMYSDDGLENIPNDLLACMKLAHENGCTWLRLDDDGEIVPGLPFHH